MLRDMCEDLPAGLVNIPAEYLEAHGIHGIELNSEPLRLWVRGVILLVALIINIYALKLRDAK